MNSFIIEISQTAKRGFRTVRRRKNAVWAVRRGNPHMPPGRLDRLKGMQEDDPCS